MNSKQQLGRLAYLAGGYYAISAWIVVCLIFLKGKTFVSGAVAGTFCIVLFLWPVLFIYDAIRFIIFHRGYFAEFRLRRILLFAFAASPALWGFLVWGRVVLQR